MTLSLIGNVDSVELWIVAIAAVLVFGETLISAGKFAARELRDLLDRLTF